MMWVFGMKAIFCTARTWIGACVFGRRVGRSCSYPMQRWCITRGHAANRDRSLWNGTSIKGWCVFIANFFGIDIPAYCCGWWLLLSGCVFVFLLLFLVFVFLVV